MVKLTESETYVLVTALRVAAEQYRIDASTFRGPSASHNERLAQQFDGQAEQAELWMERLENAEAIVITEVSA